MAVTAARSSTNVAEMYLVNVVTAQSYTAAVSATADSSATTEMYRMCSSRNASCISSNGMFFSPASNLER